MTVRWGQLGWKVALGLALFAGVNVVVYWSSTFFLRSRHYHQDIQAALGRPDLSVILLGDSHVEKIPNKLLAAGAHNAGAGGDSFRECYAKLRYLLDQGVPVRTLVLTADYHMFAAGRVESSNRSFVDGFLLTTGVRDAYEKGMLSAMMNLVPLLNDDFVQYLRSDLRERLQDRRPASGRSASWQELSAETREERARATGNSDHRGLGVQEETYRWYQRVLALAREHGIAVVSVRYPITGAYMEGAGADGRRRIDDRIAELGIHSVIDLRRTLSDPVYFRDEDHVSETGAAAVLCMLEAQTGLHLAADQTRRMCSATTDGRVTGG